MSLLPVVVRCDVCAWSAPSAVRFTATATVLASPGPRVEGEVRVEVTSMSFDCPQCGEPMVVGFRPAGSLEAPGTRFAVPAAPGKARPPAGDPGASSRETLPAPSHSSAKVRIVGGRVDPGQRGEG